MVQKRSRMIRLTKPEIGKEEIREVGKVLRSGFLVQDENVEKFESTVSEYLGVEYAVAVSSGTAALHLSLISLGIKQGDEVIIPDFTFPATGNVVALVGAKPILVDIDLMTYNIDATRIEEKITPRTKAIVPVHEFGQSADMDPILDIAKKHNLFVIEDAACALGAEYKARKCGTLGNVGCFSFHPRKTVTTGEGGVVVTNSPDIAVKIKILRNHGITKKDGIYLFTLPGFNYRMTDFQGALGWIQMRKLDEIIVRRGRIAAIYDSILRDNDLLRVPLVASDNKHIYQSYVVLIDNNIDRNALINILRKNGIETTIGTYALHCQPYYQENYGYKQGDLDNSYTAYKQCLCLPMYSMMSQKSIKMVTSGLLKALLTENANMD